MMTFTEEDFATPALRGMIERLSDHRSLHARMAMAAEKTVLNHLRTVKLPQGNRFGAPSTGFWKKAIDSVFSTATGAEATVSIPARGVALQYYGGTVRPTNKQCLTIPLNAMAYGKSARELAPLIRVKDVLFKKIGDGSAANLVPMFALRKSVTIRPHPDVLPSKGVLAEVVATEAEIYCRRHVNH